MPIDLQEIINRVTATAEADNTKTAEEATVDPNAAKPEETKAEATTEVKAEAPAEVKAEEVTVDANADLKKVAAEMDEAGRVMARSFYDELQKLAVGAHGYVDTMAEEPENPAVQVSTKPERQENAMKAVSILQQLTAGERMHGADGYIQVNGQPVSGTASEIPVEEHPVAYDATKRANAKLIETIYNRFFGGN